MRRIPIAVAILLLSDAVAAAEFSGYASITSDYVKRGVTQSDGDPAVQLGLDVGFDSGIYLGVWGSTIDIQSGTFGQRDTELNYYVGYIHDVGNDWRFSANVVAYDYPGASGFVDYSYEEFVLGANYADRVWLEVAYSPDADGIGRSATNIDVFAEWPLNDTWSVGGGGGHYDIARSSRNSYQYWQLGITGSFRYADVDLRIHDANRWIPIISSAERAESRVSLTIRVPF